MQPFPAEIWAIIARYLYEDIRALKIKLRGLDAKYAAYSYKYFTVQISYSAKCFYEVEHYRDVVNDCRKQTLEQGRELRLAIIGTRSLEAYLNCSFSKHI